MPFGLRFRAPRLVFSCAPVWLGPLLVAAACGGTAHTSPSTAPLTDAATEVIPVCCMGEGGGDGGSDGASADEGSAGPDVGTSDGGSTGSNVAPGDAARDAIDGAQGADGAETGAPTPDGASCNGVAVSEMHAIEGANHLANCAVTSYATSPPSSGNHYGTWAAYRTYATTVPWGFLVHDLEHGAVVVSYNCPSGCAAEVAAAQALLDSYPPDPICGIGPPSRRFVLVPEPDLDVRFAASAWGWTLRSPCFDTSAFKSFIDAHYAQGPEDLCGDGTDPTGGPSGPPLCP